MERGKVAQAIRVLAQRVKEKKNQKKYNLIDSMDGYGYFSKITRLAKLKSNYTKIVDKVRKLWCMCLGKLVKGKKGNEEIGQWESFSNATITHKQCASKCHTYTEN